MAAGAAADELLQRRGVKEPQAIGLLDGPLQALLWDYLGKVQKGSRDGRDWDAFVLGDVARIEASCEVQVDSVLTAPRAAGNRHIDVLSSGAVEAPPLPPGAVAQGRAASVRQDWRQHASLDR